MPHGSASNRLGKPSTPATITPINQWLVFMLRLLQFDARFDPPPAILLAVTDPDLVQLLPIAAAAMDREPRSGHKVDPFQSQPDPEMIEAHSLHGATGHQR